MVNNHAEYQQYLEAINTLAGIQQEMAKRRRELSAKQQEQKKLVDSEKQKKTEELDQICEAAVKQFRELSLHFREVCGRPAAVSAAEPCTISLKEAAHLQVTAAAALEQELDEIVTRHESAQRQAIAEANGRREREKQEAERRRLAEQKRINEELQRRQQELDGELRRAGYWRDNSDAKKLQGT